MTRAVILFCLLMTAPAGAALPELPPQSKPPTLTEAQWTEYQARGRAWAQAFHDMHGDRVDAKRFPLNLAEATCLIRNFIWWFIHHEAGLADAAGKPNTKLTRAAQWIGKRLAEDKDRCDDRNGPGGRGVKLAHYAFKLSNDVVKNLDGPKNRQAATEAFWRVARAAFGGSASSTLSTEGRLYQVWLWVSDPEKADPRFKAGAVESAGAFFGLVGGVMALKGSPATADVKSLVAPVPAE